MHLVIIRGIDFDQVVLKVAEAMKLAPDQVTACGKSPQIVQARSLLSFWSNRKLGMTTTEIAMRFKINQPAASRCWKRREQIEKDYRQGDASLQPDDPEQLRELLAQTHALLVNSLKKEAAAS